MSAISPRPPGSTPQSVRTPQSLIQRITQTFGPLELDLAADGPNICPIYFDESDNSLEMNWHEIAQSPGSWFWLNPPFNASSKFLPKCSNESILGARIISLVQTATSSCYWLKNVWGNLCVQVIHLLPRIPFEGYVSKIGKPMGANIDCSLILWNPAFAFQLKPNERIMTWDWKKEGSTPKPLWGD